MPHVVNIFYYGLPLGVRWHRIVEIELPRQDDRVEQGKLAPKLRAASDSSPSTPNKGVYFLFEQKDEPKIFTDTYSPENLNWMIESRHSLTRSLVGHSAERLLGGRRPMSPACIQRTGPLLRA